MNRLASIPKLPLLLTVGCALLWLAGWADWMWFGRRVSILQWLVLPPALPVSAAWLWWVTRPVRRRPLPVAVTATLVYPPCWLLALFAADLLALDVFRAHLARIGTGALFFLGLAWTVWLLERAARGYERERLARRLRQQRDATAVPSGPSQEQELRIWNPLDPDAWYYGRRSRRLNQSVTGFTAYSFGFLLLFLLMTRIGGCYEIYELPAGGGEQQTITQQVKVQKIIRKKYVINPFSAIRWKIPPIDEVPLQLTEITRHEYTVGYGQGTGAGFAGGTRLGRVRFIRLEYSGGDWHAGGGVGADLNMLIEYGIRTQQQVAKETESRTVAQLANFPVGKSPPVVYLTGQRNISLSNSEVRILREYLLDKHGMLFGDNGGSRHFHNQFVAMMHQVLPNVRPVPIPLDDVIHRVPFQIPFLPYVAPHGGTEALGWKVDGRWVCYYHPGDIGDAWSDDHSGVKPEVWQACYQLGTNVIFYAHAEYAKWLAAQQKE